MESAVVDTCVRKHFGGGLGLISLHESGLSP